MKVKDLEFKEVKLIIPSYFEDNRGYSVEPYSSRTLKEYGITNNFIVDYECLNHEPGTIRGLHFQSGQTKLVRVLRGGILDFVIDLRKSSGTYKKWIKHSISSENRKQIYIPSGYGHAYITTQPDTVVFYKFDDYYEKKRVKTIRWDDPEIGIPWAVEHPILSDNDRNAPRLNELDIR